MRSTIMSQDDDDNRPRRVYKNADIILEASPGVGALHLGDFSAAQDKAYFQKHKISCILTVAIIDKFISHKDVIRHHKIVSVEDRPETKLSTYFKDCFKFIHEHRNKGESVLVHCMAGVSRSATIVIGYLMTVYPAMDFETAFAQVRKKRKVIRPNDGFLEQLREYDKQIEEKRKKK